MHEPLRRCIGCGEVRPKRLLLRLAIEHDGPDGSARVVIDRTPGKLPGRGAYLCAQLAARPPKPEIRCLRAAGRARAIARSLRGSAGLSAELIESSERG